MARGRPRLTPWFDGTVRPWRVGVYQRRVAGQAPVYSKWDGQRWLCMADNRELAAQAVDVSNIRHSALSPWRGRAERAG